jgi:hypothetical protein
MKLLENIRENITEAFGNGRRSRELWNKLFGCRDKQNWNFVRTENPEILTYHDEYEKRLKIVKSYGLLRNIFYYIGRRG